jgi:uncharacterized protein (TIGR02679 family)
VTSRWDDGLEAILRRVHERLGRDPGARSVSVRLGPEEREALADLLGMERWPPEQFRLPLTGARGLAAAVAEAAGRPLLDELVERFGPLVDPASARRHERADRDQLWAWWTAHPAFAHDPALAAWAASVRSAGVRGAEPRRLLEQVFVVLGALPADDELLPVLSGRLLNDTHALDAGRAVAGLVLGAVAAEQGVPRPADAAGRRALWHSVGVRDDQLSSTVLVAGFRPPGASVAAQICRLSAEVGEVASLTLGQVRQGAEDWGAEVVHVVENPAILSLAADEFGVQVPPMVCTSGWPSAAATTLLTRLRDSGVRMLYHGDLDGEGLRVAAHLGELVGAEPWRMSTQDYLAHVPDHGAAVGRVTDVAWDAGLAEALRERRIAVLEENVWPDLEADLRTFTVSSESAFTS